MRSCISAHVLFFFVKHVSVIASGGANLPFGKNGCLAKPTSANRLIGRGIGTFPCTPIGHLSIGTAHAISHRRGKVNQKSRSPLFTTNYSLQGVKHAVVFILLLTLR